MGSDRYVWPFNEDDFREFRPGFRQRVFTGDDLMVSFWRIRDGEGPTPYAGHPDNEQFGIVIAGELDFRIGSDHDRHTLRPGDVYWAPKNFPHGDSRFRGDPAHGETWILDIFTPPRPEYRGD